ncbi:MAG: hypothetical protein KAT77_00955 [Nanoarchaeota archaeon]|nr:hypothetical protein [Nanoarchaeota archaeon]
MKKIILLLSLILVLSTFAYAADESSVADALSNIVDSIDSYDDIFIVYGDNAAEQDNLGALMISDIFKIIDEDKGRAPYIKKASEVNNLQNQHLILVGGPCANQISEKITDEAGYNCHDWKFRSGESVIKTFKNGQKIVFLVAGTSMSDTWKISKSIRRYKKSNKLKSSNEVVFETPAQGKCGNDICETKENDDNCPNDCSNEGSIQLTSGLEVKRFDISGDYIAFEASGSYGSSPDIFVYNLKTQKQTKIGKGDFPKIDGNNVVFTGRQAISGSNSDWPTVSLYSIPNQKITVLANAELKTYYLSPNIHGNNVIWEKYNEKYEDRDKPYGLYHYHIDSKDTQLLTDIERNKYLDFDIFKDNIAYEDEGNVYLFNIKDKQKKKITSAEERQAFPVLYKDTVAWVDGRGAAEGERWIYLYDIPADKESKLPIEDYESGPGFSTISFQDNQIIWTDYRNNNGDIYFYDIDRNIERRITISSANQGDGKLGRDYAVWITTKNNDQDLYALKLS